MPALWALPAGIGDVIVGAMAPWIAAARRHAAGQTTRDHLPSVRYGRSGRRGWVGRHDQPGGCSGLSHHADVRAGDALSPRVGTDVPRAARLRAARDFVVATARRPMGASSRRLTWTEPMMSPQAIFLISVLLGLVVWGMIVARYVWPALRDRPRTEALRPVLFLHAFRFVGLSFLVPGVVSPALPAAFAQPAAYGDLATSMLALLAIAMLGSRAGDHPRLGVQQRRHRGSAQCVLSGRSAGRGDDTRPAGCRVTSSPPCSCHFCS